MATPEGADRRRFPRLSIRLPVTYWEMPAANLRPTVTSNIGGGGVALYVSDELPVGTKLHIELELPNPRRVVQFIGEVMWCRPIEADPHPTPKRVTPTIIAGIRFAGITIEDQQAILKYCQPRQ